MLDLPEPCRLHQAYRPARQSRGQCYLFINVITLLYHHLIMHNGIIPPSEAGVVLRPEKCFFAWFTKDSKGFL